MQADTRLCFKLVSRDSKANYNRQMTLEFAVNSLNLFDLPSIIYVDVISLIAKFPTVLLLIFRPI